MKYLMNIIFLFLFQMISLTSYSEQRDASPDIEHVIGQMFMIGFRGTELEDNAWILKDIKKNNLGGVVLYDYDVALRKKVRNVSDPAQLAALVKKLRDASATPLLIAIDQEGGRVNRLKTVYGFPETFSAKYLGSLNDPERIRAEGRSIGKTLYDLGINIDLAPVVDLNVNPDNPAIGKIERSFSDDPEKVVECARMFINGLHDEKVLSCIKHFPGHGSAYNDSHKGITDITSTWNEIELVPFEMIIKDNGCDMVMTAHVFNKNLDDRYPATLSKKIITGILREKLSYDGVVITDDMQMRAVKKYFGLKQSIYLAVDSGADIILIANNLSYDPFILKKAVNIVKRLLAEKKLTRERLMQSYDRIMLLKRKLPGK